MVQIQQSAVRRLLLAIFAAGLALGAPAQRSWIRPLTCSIPERAYTNVTVTTRAPGCIYIFHSAGMTSIRITDLPLDVRQQLGYAPPEPPKPEKTNDTVTVSARELAGVKQNLKPLEDDLKRRLGVESSGTARQQRGPLHAGRDRPDLSSFHSYCSPIDLLQSKKSGQLPGVGSRAADPSHGPRRRHVRVVVLRVLCAGSNLVALVLWSLNIVKARGKHVTWRSC